ncbi:MAG: RidA family protein [Deltaproteobacteria bacterium]|nr:RidA family protein [Deltaproteobacteria bacterium]
MAVKPASRGASTRTPGKIIQPKGWIAPRGYANGILKTGQFLAIGGQIGGKPPGMALERGMPGQFAQCLDNVLAVVHAAGGEPKDLVSMTIYVTDQRQYHAANREIANAWRKRMGKHYPAMALVEVAGLMEQRALIEIQAFAVL